MLPLSLPIWLAGLWYLFFDRQGKRFRVLGWAWAVTAAVIMALSPRIYYLFPAFPILFASGSVVWERWLATVRAQWVKRVYLMLMVLMSAALAPTLLPLLPPETYIRYAAATHLQQPRIENHRLGPLPQLFADQFGWEEMAATVARVYNGLPPERPSRDRRSSARITGKPAPSTCSVRSTVCRPPSAGIKATSSGDRAATPAKVSS